MIVLGIESSCDDTSAAIIENGVLLSNRIANQQVHKEFGGVVPELASRAHQQNIIPVVEAAIKESGKTPDQLRALEDRGLDGERLARTSKAVAKVDNAAIQAGYQLYHHVFFVDQDENWTVVQQGMDSKTGDARRYHWISEQVRSYVEEPHSGMISGEVKSVTLDMTSRKSEECRSTSVDIVKDEPHRIRRLFESIQPHGESTLVPWLDGFEPPIEIPSYKVIPRRMDWEAVRRAYETQPSNYENLLMIEGIGPATVRGLALIAEMIFGSSPSWSDPVRMTFAFGGKDGVPFPVPRREYDKAISFMEQTLNEARMGNRDRVVALKRLRRFAPPLLRPASE